jgi:hypothetical protein
MRHHICREQLQRFMIVLVRAADQQLHASVPILPDQVGDLRHSTSEPIVGLGNREPLAFRGQCVCVSRQQRADDVRALDRRAITILHLAMAPQHLVFMSDHIGAAADIARIGKARDHP